MIQPKALAEAGAKLLGAVDGLVTSGEERGKLRLALKEYQHSTTRALMDLEGKEIETRGKLILAEAQSDSKLAKTWRPLLALSFGFIVVWNYAIVILLEWMLQVGSGFGLGEITPPPRLDMPTEVFALLTVMIGGYVGSRWHEKIKASERITTGELDFGKGLGGLVNQGTIKRLLKMIKKEKDPGIRQGLVDQLKSLTEKPTGEK